jgi:protein pelota
MWHAYNLVRPGDSVTATTFRKVAAPPGAAGGASERVKITLTVSAESTEYDAAGLTLRVAGRNTTECESVRLGARHTLELAPHRAFSVFKARWDALDTARLRAATELAATADLAVLLIQEGLATLCLVGGATSSAAAKVEVSLPRKKGAAAQGYDKAIAAFYERCLAAVLRCVDWGVVKCLLVAGPGFSKDGFRAHALAEASKRDIKAIAQNADRIILAHASCAYRHALREVLSSDAARAAVAHTAASRDAAALEAFFETLAATPDRAFYGPGHVGAAADMGAVATLLVSDTLFRNADPGVRAAYVALTETVRASGGVVHVLSGAHASGEALDRVTGVAAILRFPAPHLDDVELPDPFQAAALGTVVRTEGGGGGGGGA